jgi:alpha 1,6-mannosyltransferase
MIDYKNVYMTNKVLDPDPVHKWEKKNGADGWAVQFYDDDQGRDWMERHFAGTDVEQTWNWLKRPVLKADFLRYLLPMVQGGVYADTDVSLHLTMLIQVAPLKPIEEWGTHDVEYLDISATDGPNWRSTLRERPSVVVGLESDCHAYWHSVGGFPRPAGICQWTLSSAPYHPIMLEAVRVVVNHTRVVTEWEEWREIEVPRLREEGKKADADALAGERVNKKFFDVVNWTGPGA